jgi:hypothetical protein
MGERDVDAEFADIIAHWDEVESLPDAPAGGTAAGPVGAEPTAADLGGPDAASLRPGSREDLPVRPAPNPVNPPPVGPFVVWRGAEQPPPSVEAPDVEEHPQELVADDDDHFEPGPTAPLPPQEDLQFWGIIVGLVAGPLMLLWLVIFRPQVSDWWTLAALALTIGGFVLLVLRQPHSRDEDDPDNGARV